MNTISEQQKNVAEQLGIAVSHYNIEGQLIHASPETLDYFTELLRFSDKTKSVKAKKTFDDVWVVSENTPIEYDISRLMGSEIDFSRPVSN